MTLLTRARKKVQKIVIDLISLGEVNFIPIGATTESVEE